MIIENILNFFKMDESFKDALIASNMELEGYTDFEIEQFLAANNDLTLDPESRT
jgi:hypothetical protein